MPQRRWADAQNARGIHDVEELVRAVPLLTSDRKNPIRSKVRRTLIETRRHLSDPSATLVRLRGAAIYAMLLDED